MVLQKQKRKRKNDEVRSFSNWLVAVIFFALGAAFVLLIQQFAQPSTVSVEQRAPYSLEVTTTTLVEQLTAVAQGTLIDSFLSYPFAQTTYVLTTPEPSDRISELDSIALTATAIVGQATDMAADPAP